MANRHVDSVQKALETLTLMRRDLVEKLAASGQRTNVWQDLRDVQQTIETLRRVEDDERKEVSDAGAKRSGTR